MKSQNIFVQHFRIFLLNLMVFKGMLKMSLVNFACDLRRQELSWSENVCWHIVFETRYQVHNKAKIFKNKNYDLVFQKNEVHSVFL